MKKQIKKVIIGVFMLNVFSLVNAQSVNIREVATTQGLMFKVLGSKTEADGSPYINEKFSLIRISNFKDKIYAARFNAFNREMEVKLEDGKTIALDVNSDLEVTFTATNKTYKIKNYTNDKGVLKRGFIAVVFENETFTLFKEERIKFKKEVKAVSSYQKDKPAKFRRENDHYYLQTNDELTFLPQNKKDLIKAFSEDLGQLKSFIKTSKLNPKKEVDLIKIAKFISKNTN